MRPGAASAPLCVLGYLIMPSDIVRNGKWVPAGALFLEQHDAASFDPKIFS